MIGPERVVRYWRDSAITVSNSALWEDDDLADRLSTGEAADGFGTLGQRIAIVDARPNAAGFMEVDRNFACRGARIGSSRNVSPARPVSSTL